MTMLLSIYYEYTPYFFILSEKMLNICDAQYSFLGTNFIGSTLKCFMPKHDTGF